MRQWLFILIISISLGSVSFAFETTSGNYIAQQDVQQILSDIFFGQTQPSNIYELRGCVVYRYQNNSADNNYYELGFNNIETGERLVHEPDAAYVLHFDSCISKIMTSQLTFYSEEFVKRVLGETGFKELNQWRDEYYKANQSKNYTTSKGDSLSVAAYFYAMNREFIVRVESKDVPEQTKVKIIETIFTTVFASPGLIPRDYMDEAKKELLLQSSAGPMTIEQFVASSYKKAIINDYFLKY